MDTTRTAPAVALPGPSRRTAVTAAAVGAGAFLLAPDRAAAHGRDHGHHAPRLPDTVRLPDGIQPEGITSGPGTTYYVGSLNDGRIVTGDLARGRQRVLLPGATGRQLRGLRWDGRSGLVWAVGNVGIVAHVWAVDARRGTVVADIVVPGGGFLNDLDIAGRTVWVTDSRVDRLTAIELDKRGRPTSGTPRFVPLGGDWPGYDGTNLAANGIRVTRGTALLDHSTEGGLWAADPRTGRVREVPVSGGPGITGGDGLELRGSTLWVVRGSGQNEVSVLSLGCGHREWTARWRGALTDKTLDVPSTATYAAGSLWAVNARFGTPSPATASYWVTRLPAR
ncbi:hypothetical protein [Phycicoccus sonneratiae]|uniref:Superoxide dismutase n=1 Tax=Phycicoccus sonneratiae TaxID=2807628 RepID=A0ABS2CPH5_9MICO|nr:hypothetical protein [Phycicoccus sonneraticus]MBM6401795.1 hypothetical protein [Phycicoccus sonneraticus]